MSEATYRTLQRGVMYSDNSGPRLLVSYTSGAPDGEPEITIRTNGGSTSFHPDDLTLIERWLSSAGLEHERWLSDQNGVD